MQIKDVTKKYNGKPVVDAVNLEIPKGKVISFIGPNGAGKSTVMGIISRLIAKDSGLVSFDGTELEKWKSKELSKRLAILTQSNNIQMKLTVRELVAFGRFPYSGNRTTKEDEEIIEQAIAYMELEAFRDRFIDELSGGQRQRVGIARALAVNPQFIVCDEPISALDVSIQAQVVNMFEELQEQMGLTYLFIAHDLSVVKNISDRIGVMYLGKMVELADSYELVARSLHPYTKSLISAIPIADPIKARASKRIVLQGDVPSPLNPPTGCRFRTRCPYADECCAQKEPEWREVEKGHYVACHHVEKINA